MTTILENGSLEEKTQQLGRLMESLFKVRPSLRNIATNTPFVEQLIPAMDWNPANFPARNVLVNIICSETSRLYGHSVATDVRSSLCRSFAVETGAHLHLPRRRDVVTKHDRFDFTPVVSQGQVFFALAKKKSGHEINISLNTGRIPANNDNSGSHLDLPSLTDPIRLLPGRFEKTAETTIPSTSFEDIKHKTLQLHGLLQSRKITQPEFLLGREILQQFQRFQGGFSDQIAVSHSLIFNKVFSNLGMTQVTLDSEKVGILFLSRLLNDSHSLIHHIFQTPELIIKFFTEFAGIDTGWSTDGNRGSVFFHHINRLEKITKLESLNLVREDGSLFLVSYNNHFKLPVDPTHLISGLNSGEIMPVGVLKFFSFMLEAGLCSVGGMNQAEYCNQIKQKTITFLRSLGVNKRVEQISQIPTSFVTISPSWGLVEINDQISGPSTMMSLALDPLIKGEIAKIEKISGKTALTLSALALGQLFGIASDLHYQDLEGLANVIIR